MKTTLFFATLISCATLATAQDKPLQERAADIVDAVKKETKDLTDATAKAAREAWKSTKAYVSQDPTDFRQSATLKLNQLATEIANLKADATKTHMAPRLYYATRLQALREHLAYAQSELAKMPGDRDQKDFAATRKHFNRTLDTLEAAIDAAQDEARESL